MHRTSAFYLTIFCLASILSFGQSAMKKSESLIALSDSLIKSEIASFTIKGKFIDDTETTAKYSLNEISMQSCTDKEVHLGLSTLTSSVSTFIHFYFRGDTPVKALDSIFLVTHSHFWVRIPDSAFKGLLQTNTCNYKNNGKSGDFHSPYYKAFYSEDKRRLYIYMLGGTDLNKYEVTWIIIDDKYYARVIDEVL